jgi:hypothetical protein
VLISTPLPRVATASLTSVYDAISKDIHPFSQLPKDVRQSLSDMLIKFNATIQSMLNELTAGINSKLEKMLLDPLQKSLNNATNGFTTQVLNGQQRGTLQDSSEGANRMQGRVENLIINMSSEKKTLRFIG